MTRMDDTFRMRWPRWMAGISCIVGAALLYVILDVHFLGHIPGATETMKHSWVANLFLGVLGILCFGVGSFLLVRSPLLLEADHSGIRIYRAIGAKQAVNVRKSESSKGGICCIPWRKISTIVAGKAYRENFNDTGLTGVEARVLLIACNSTIRLEEYSWTGEVATGLGPATPEECKMWPGSRISGHENEPHLILNEKYLPCSLSEAVKTLSDMKERYS